MAGAGPMRLIFGEHRNPVTRGRIKCFWNSRDLFNAMLCTNPVKSACVRLPTVNIKNYQWRIAATVSEHGQ